ncbi:MAG: hypothetical protein M0R06_09470 [Sphaerochaeta sp.]|nr:hypothetical protein [Sphaerochaeta sp.]
MDYTLKIKGGQLELPTDQRKHFESQMKAAMQIADHGRRMAAVAAHVLGPIRKVAEYLEWTDKFFANDPARPNDVVRIAQDTYTAIAYMSSPDGQILYTRPGKSYTTVSWRHIRCGLEIPWDAGDWGWDVMGTKMMEAAEELARRRDEVRQPLLDAAAIGQAGHIPTVATTLTKASIDSIIQGAARVGFPITQVAVNIGRLMDQTSWALPANSMVSGVVPESYGRDLMTRLYFNGYGGLTWIANHTIPYDYLYLTGPASKIGWQFLDAVRGASETNIDRDVDKHNWRQNIAAHIEGSQWVWRLQVV